MKTVAIFGGTFDPIHLGHLRSALELKQRLQLDEVRLLPCYLPAHREVPGCSGEQRRKMVELACADTSLVVDDRELRRRGPSYSVETLEQLRAELGGDISLSWVMGTDAFNGLERWHRWRDLLPLAHIVVIARPGQALATRGAVSELLATCRTDVVDDIKQRASGCILPVSLAPYPIAATQIRESLKKGESVAGVLPAAVVDYIEQYQLYR